MRISWYRVCRTIGIFSLILTLSACDGSDGATGATGATGPQGDPGADANENIGMIQGQLAPGGTLTLSHTLSTYQATAEFEHAGARYDSEEFSSVYEAIDPYSGKQFFRGYNPDTLVSYEEIYGVWSVWKNGDGGYSVVNLEQPQDNTIDEISLYYEEFDASKESLGNRVELKALSRATDWEREIISSAPIGNRIVVVEVPYSNRDTTQAIASIFEKDGTVVVGPVAIGVHAGNAPFSVVELPNGNIATCNNADWNALENEFETLNLIILDPTDLSTISTTELGDSSTDITEYGYELDSCRMHLTPNDKLMVAYNTYDGPDFKAVVSVYDASGSEATPPLISTPPKLSDSYLVDNTSMASSASGNTLITYEIGGPDAAAYAIIDEAGNYISAPRSLALVELDMMTALAFEDGSFSVMATEDESLTPVLYHIRADGTLEPDSSRMVMADSPGYGDFFPGFVTGPYTFDWFYQSYNDGSGGHAIEVYKNRLAVSHGTGEVSVTNQSRHTVDVILSVTGEPAAGS